MCSQLNAVVISACVAVATVLARAQVCASQQVVMGQVASEYDTPLSGVAITATNATGHAVSARSDSAGSFRITLAARDSLVIVRASLLGFLPEQVAIRPADTSRSALVVRLRLRRGEILLPPVKTVARRPRPPQDDERLIRSPGQTREILDFGSGVSGDLSGDLASALSMIPGVITTPGPDGRNTISAFGLGAEQNGITLNGMDIPDASLPRDGLLHQVRMSTYDPKFGRYSGLQIAASLWCACRNPTRTFHTTVDEPVLQNAASAAPRFEPAFSHGIVSGTLSGTAFRDSSYFNVAYQLERRSALAATLFSRTPASLAAMGLNADSVERLRATAVQVGLPLGPATSLGTDATSGSVVARVDLTPGAASIGGVTSPTVYVLAALGISQSRSQDISATTTPLHAGDANRRSGQFTLVLAPYLFDALNETKVSFAASRATTAPRFGLPEVDVRLLSDSGGGSIGAATVQLGGARGRTEDQRTSLQLTNETSWMTLDGGHRFQIYADVALSRVSETQSANPFGTFVFNSIGGLADGRPESFTRDIGDRRTRGSVFQGALAISDIVKQGTDSKASSIPRGEGLTVQYGARLEADRFLDPPRLNAEVLSVFERRTSSLPGSLLLSPMVGFTWNRGAYRESVPSGGWYSADRLLVTGGVREYRGVLPPLDVYRDAQESGLQPTDLTVMCVGSASPIPTWSSTPALADAPTACREGASPALVQTKTPISVFSESFAAPRSWRAEMNWRVRASGRLFVVAGTSYSLNLGGVQRADINFDGRQKSWLTAESGRPVFVTADGIDAATGAVSNTGSRAAADFGAVNEIRSDLHATQQQMVAGIEYQIGRTVATSSDKPDRNRLSGTLALNYTHASGSMQTTGFAGTTAGDPRTVEWSRSSTPRHTLQAVFAGELTGWFTLGASARISSGTSFTPYVSGDINGDGIANDRAFVFAADIPGGALVGGGMAKLLATSPDRIRDCLGAQASRIAAVNSCDGPWTATIGTISLAMDSYRIGLGNRGVLSLFLGNALGGIDWLLHGSRSLRGWGQNAYPDPVLLQVRGYDVASSQFRYTVNPRFGSTTNSEIEFRSPVRLTADLRVDLGTDAETRAIEDAMRMAKDNGLASSSASLASFFIQLVRPRSNGALEAIIRFSDSLALRPGQVDELRALQKQAAARSDSLYTRLATYLFARQGRYGGEAVRSEWHRTIGDIVVSSIASIDAARALLTQEQLDWLRSRRIAPSLFYSREWLAQTLRGPLAPR
jgi:hypothetical protein